ncbi:MAG: SPOR domain-containing protein [Ignavibacteria bacterium]
MLKFVKLNIALSFLTAFLLIWGCSSGEYEINKYKVDYEEKIIKVDTIRKITLKEEIKETIKDSYNFSVQIGAFVNPANLDRFFERAKDILSENVYYEQTANLFKVRVGNFSNRAEALKFLEFAKSKGYFDAFVIAKKK